MPKCPDVKELTRQIERVALDVRASTREFDKEIFLKALHERCGALFTHEQLVYCLEEYAWSVGLDATKSAVKRAGKRDPAQLPLPMDLADLDIPLVLPIVRANGKRVCVVTMHATLEDCDAYVKGIEGNINACIKRLTEFLALLKVVRPIMLAHPGMTVGQAMQKLLDQEKSAA